MTVLDNGAYENALKQLNASLEIFDKGNTNLFETLKSPTRVIEVNIPVKMDDGSVKSFVGYRSQHNDARGPFKGGIRFHQDVNIGEVKALSMWMSFKTGVLDLPLGGGKGGIIVNPKELSSGELERLARGYVRGLYKYIGPGHDVPAPDVNTNPQIMAWMMDEYSKLVGKYSPGSFTGKPLTSGGSKGRGEATAQGGVYALERVFTLEGKEIKGKTVVIQGAGNAGLTMAYLLEEKGAKVIAISDSRGGIYDENGIDVNKVRELKGARKSVSEYTGAKSVTNEEILEIKTDILVPAALENVITEENADRIDAGIIVELANGPTTPEADAILEKKNIDVLPDILANAGGVTVSYFEQVQNDQNYYWSEEEVAEKLKTKMDTATEGVYHTAKEYSVSYRKAAYIVAVKRIKDAMQDRGQL